MYVYIQRDFFFEVILCQGQLTTLCDARIQQSIATRLGKFLHYTDIKNGFIFSLGP